MLVSEVLREKRAIGSVITGALALVVLYRTYKNSQNARKEALKAMDTNGSSPSLGDKDGKAKKVAVDKEFIRRLKYLLSIVLPGVKSKEFGILLLHSSFLVSRTLVSIYVAKLDGKIVKSIVDREFESFVWLMTQWLTIAIPATYINSMILYLESKLSIAFRTRLTNFLYERYMTNETYYKVVNLDSRLSNPDQCLTEDANEFCGELAHLYSHLSKPCLDIVLMTAQLIYLSRSRGSGNSSLISTLLATIVIGGTGYILKLFTPPFGKLVAEQARRYGELRAAHSRVITHSEEIAFYGGEKLEHSVLQQIYHHLIRHVNSYYKIRISYTMLEQFLMRYVWSACGMVMIAIPTFAMKKQAPSTTSSTTTSTTNIDEHEDSVSNRTQDFVTSRGLLISAADAIERMMSSWKEIAELAGRTARIYDMIQIFEDVKNGRFRKAVSTNVSVQLPCDHVSDDIDAENAPSHPNELDALDATDLSLDPDAKNKLKKSRSTVNIASTTPKNTNTNNIVTQEGSPDDFALTDCSKKNIKKSAINKGVTIGGTLYDNSEYIELKDVPIMTPNGDVLIEKMSFRINPQMHLLITGPNGCGKSSLFRLIGGLWPLMGGEMHKPSKASIFYIPQRPYLTRACLRDQFIYPDTSADMKARGITDSDLDAIIDIVNLKGVVEQAGGLDATNDWRDVLSGGEKQRVAMARLFYHKPKYAILDECTSAVSIDVEGRMYTAAKNAGITLLTVTHRPTLWKYHDWLLQFDGQGNYSFKQLNATARLTIQEEKAKLEQSLAGVPDMTKRLGELCALLGEDSIYTTKQQPQQEGSRNDRKKSTS